MKIDERRRSVLRYLKLVKNEVVPISDLAFEVDASIRTIKNDLRFLADLCPIKMLRGMGGGVQFSDCKIIDGLISIISFDDEKEIDYCQIAVKQGYIPISFKLYFSTIYNEKIAEEAYIVDLEYFVIEKSCEIWVLGKKNERNSLLCYAEKLLKSIKYFDEENIEYEH